MTEVLDEEETLRRYYEEKYKNDIPTEENLKRWKIENDEYLKEWERLRKIAEENTTVASRHKYIDKNGKITNVFSGYKYIDINGEDAIVKYCKKEKSLAIKNPKLLLHWDFTKNDVNPYHISCNCLYLAYWRCTETKCNHHIERKTVTRASLNKSCCAFCENCNPSVCPCDSFPCLKPSMMKLFKFSKNRDFDPYKTTTGSNQMIKWSCDNKDCCCGEWEQSISNRYNSNIDCPICYGNYVCRHNCLPNHPSTKQYMVDYREEDNPGVDIYQISHGSNNVILNWFCHVCSNPWKSGIHWRINCPSCNDFYPIRKIRDILENHSIEYELEKKFSGCVYIKHLRYDLYLFSMNILIELDGKQHFKDNYYIKKKNIDTGRIRDSIKNIFAKKNKIHLLRISGSEVINMEKIIIEFIDDVKKTSETLQRFVGKEYIDHIYPDVPAFN